MGEISLWSLGGVGLAGGLLGAMLGLGGGVFIVPLLTLVLNLPIHIAIASSLVAVIANSITASGTHLRARLPNLRLGMFLLTATTIGAVGGAFLADLLSSPILAVIFGIALTGIGYSMIRHRKTVQGKTSNGEARVSASRNSANLASSLTASYYDRNLNKVVNYTVSHVPQGWGINLLVGIASSLLGVGGGIINIPVMNLVMRVPIKASMATNSFMVGITALAGACVYYYNGYVYPMTAAPVMVGSFVGALAGAQLVQRARSARLRQMFAIVMLILAVLMILRAFNIGLPA
ncbi:MAG TPA: sulfite exporter TauE/SafE family protein [Dehalococcoidales bacterium]|nr:sulfite exporter TauE/SafE family protein [Dehalococcoidales bacterium]